MSEIRVNRIVSADGANAPQFPAGFSLATGMGITNSPNITGSAVTFSGLSQITNATDSTSTTTGSLVVTGGVGIAKNVYIGAGLSIAGTLTYEDVTNVDSVGMITAKSGLNVSGGEVTVGSAVTIGSAGVSTFSSTVTFANPADGGKYAEWVPASDKLHLQDDTNLSIGSGDDLKLYHNGSGSYIDDTGTGSLYIRAGTDNGIVINTDDSVQIYWDGSERIRTTGAGTSCVGISTVQEFSSMGMLKERVKIVGNKLSAANNIDLKDGNVYYFTTNETGTATPNIRYDGSHTLNNKMLIGETVAVSIIFKPNNAGYYAQMTIDSGAQTEEWLGGAAPDSANSGGYDVVTYQITKTADATFLVLANTSNYA